MYICIAKPTDSLPITGKLPDRLTKARARMGRSRTRPVLFCYTCRVSDGKQIINHRSTDHNPFTEPFRIFKTNNLNIIISNVTHIWLRNLLITILLIQTIYWDGTVNITIYLTKYDSWWRKHHFFFNMEHPVVFLLQILAMDIGKGSGSSFIFSSKTPWKARINFCMSSSSLFGENAHDFGYGLPDFLDSKLPLKDSIFPPIKL